MLQWLIITDPIFSWTKLCPLHNINKRPKPRPDSQPIVQTLQVQHHKHTHTSAGKHTKHTLSWHCKHTNTHWQTPTQWPRVSPRAQTSCFCVTAKHTHAHAHAHTHTHTHTHAHTHTRTHAHTHTVLPRHRRRGTALQAKLLHRLCWWGKLLEKHLVQISASGQRHDRFHLTAFHLSSAFCLEFSLLLPSFHHE